MFEVIIEEVGMKLSQMITEDLHPSVGLGRRTNKLESAASEQSEEA